MTDTQANVNGGDNDSRASVSNRNGRVQALFLTEAAKYQVPSRQLRHRSGSHTAAKRGCRKDRL
jgi:hypothetical protein